MTDAPSAAALEQLALERWWQDDVDGAIAARERAYALRRDAGETIEAARVAAFLAWDHGAMRGANAVANGWLQRAKRLVGEEPAAPEHAWLLLIEASFYLDTDAAAVLRLSTEAVERASALGGVDIEMTARTLQGLALVSLGRVDEGTPLLDEGTAAAISGELHDPLAIGSCCCNMIIACERSRDYDRAGQWCEQLAAYCERTGQRPLLALCRAHHGTVRMMRGEWRQAEEDLAWAVDALTVLRPPLAGYAAGRLAQLRRRQGRQKPARAALAKAGTHVLAAFVRAELALDDGDLDVALDEAERHLRTLGTGQPVERAAGLELLVAVRVRRADPDAAQTAHAELAGIADAVGGHPLRAAERAAAAAIALARREHDAARVAAEDAVDRYAACVMPFEAAHARLLLARALSGLGRVTAAGEQEGIARAALAELAGRREREGVLTPREAEVLALVAEGLSNRAIAERLVVSEHTVHRHMANIYARLGVSSRAAAVARAAEDGPIGR